MSEWQQYTSMVAHHTVTGDLRIRPAFYSPQLDNKRDVLVWLPPGYAQDDKRYPVLYMHDAQNLFDASTSYVGEWRVDETMTALHQEGCAAIIVGLCNLPDVRRIEYSPYPHRSRPDLSGRGADYIRFIVDTLKPVIDADFRTLPDAPHTGIAGSSMGGLISLYAFLTRHEVFGFCGAFSPAYWFGNNGLKGTVQQLARGEGKVYMDIGTHEGYIFAGMPPEWGVTSEQPDNAYLNGVRDLRDALVRGGYVEGGSLMYVEEVGALHNEEAWARRLPDALRFLLRHTR